MMEKEDKAFWTLVQKEEEAFSEDFSGFVKFLAYTHDDGPDDVEAEPERRGIRKLKGTPVWTMLYPARKGYRALRFLYENGISGIYRKAENAVENSRFKRRKEARKYLTEIMPAQEEKDRQRECVFSKDITFSVLVPLYNTPEMFLREMIESVLGQTYEKWELCLADASDDGRAGEIVKEYAERDARIRYQKLGKNAGIAENTNECIRMSSGSYLALFDHDDLLHPCALYECAKTIEAEDPGFLYTDEVTFEGSDLSGIVTYHFKPDFSVENLRGVNYICHLSVFKRELLDEVGLFRKEYDGSQDHDMILRLTDAAGKVCHIPQVLYFWRSHKMSTSMNLNSKSYAVAAGRNAVRDAELRRGYPARVHSAQICKTHYRLEYEMKMPKISILIDGTGQELLLAAKTAAAVRKMSTYQNYEISYAKPQQLARAAREADGEYLLLLAAGIAPVTPSFVEELLMFAQQKEIGLVGMQVLDGKGLIVSSDIIISAEGGFRAIEANCGERYDAPGYMGRNYYAHDISAISGCACMGRKEELLPFLEKKDFSGRTAKILEACFCLRQAEKRIVVNPYALCRMACPDGVAAVSEADRQKLAGRYREQIRSGDPYYNPNLSLERCWKKI